MKQLVNIILLSSFIGSVSATPFPLGTKVIKDISNSSPNTIPTTTFTIPTTAIAVQPVCDKIPSDYLGSLPADCKAFGKFLTCLYVCTDEANVVASYGVYRVTSVASSSTSFLKGSKLILGPVVPLLNEEKTMTQKGWQWILLSTGSESPYMQPWVSFKPSDGVFTSNEGVTLSPGSIFYNGIQFSMKDMVTKGNSTDGSDGSDFTLKQNAKVLYSYSNLAIPNGPCNLGGKLACFALKSTSSTGVSVSIGRGTSAVGYSVNSILSWYTIPSGAGLVVTTKDSSIAMGPYYTTPDEIYDTANNLIFNMKIQAPSDSNPLVSLLSIGEYVFKGAAEFATLHFMGTSSTINTAKKQSKV